MHPFFYYIRFFLSFKNFLTDIQKQQCTRSNLAEVKRKIFPSHEYTSLCFGSLQIQIKKYIYTFVEVDLYIHFIGLCIFNPSRLFAFYYFILVYTADFNNFLGDIILNVSLCL